MDRDGGALALVAAGGAGACIGQGIRIAREGVRGGTCSRPIPSYATLMG